MHSEQVTDLLPALAAAIADMPDPRKNASNPHFRNRFADLGEVMECIAGPLHAHGLVVTQTLAGENVLVTRVWHAKSGQWIESRLPLLLVKADPQGQGSAITYARRYALKALFGMVDADDDGNKASERPKPAHASPPPTQRAEPPRGPAPYDDPRDAADAIAKITTREGLRAIASRISASSFSDEEVTVLRALAAKKKFAEGT